jgi:choline dehydrogenase-like flavoprotein
VSEAGDDAEVIVVGSGPTGVVVARRLAAAGVDVLCLEQGDYPDESVVVGGRRDWELAGRGPANASPNVRRAPADYAIEEDDSEMKVLTWNGVGGGSVMWAAQWERFLPSDFAVRSLDGVADDWPLSFKELAPFYDRLDREFGVAARVGDPAFPPGGDPAHPALPIMPVGERVARAHNELGWHWWPGPVAIGAACRLLGVCAYGCPHGQKVSVDATHWPAALAAGARLRTGARVRRILTERDVRAGRGVRSDGGPGGVGGPGGASARPRPNRASGVEWVDAEGREHVSRAAAVVLAANGIGTARLLLASTGPDHPDGLGNGSGLVGRNLMLHPHTRVVGLFDEDLGTNQGHWGQLLHCLEFAETDPARGFPRGAKWNLGPGSGSVTAALHPWPGEPRWGKAPAEHAKAWLGRSAVWGITADDLPSAVNRVELDPERTDAAGLPLPVLHYKIPAEARAILDFNRARATESFEAAGATRVLDFELMPGFGWHQLGTARMGADSSTSVVDEWSRLHEVPNVIVADASVFVTGSSLNPTATACALALRATERLLADRAR